MTFAAGCTEQLKIVSRLFIGLATYRERASGIRFWGEMILQGCVPDCIALHVVFSGADTYIRWTACGM